MECRRSWRRREMVEAESIAEAALEFDVRLRREGANSARLHVGQRGIQLNSARRALRPFGALAGRFLFASQIYSVYREGDCIRVEFREDGRYAEIQFWADDPSAAARIVAHLPTARTVEVEDSPRVPNRPRKPLFAPAFVASVIAVLVALAATVWWARDRSRDSPAHLAAASTPRVPGKERAPAQAVAEPAANLGTLTEDWNRMERANGALELQFRVALTALQEGSLSPAGFIFGLEDWLSPQWRSQERQLEALAPTGPRATELRQLEIAVAKDWDAALLVYVTGLRERNPETVLRAFRLIGMAEQAERNAQRLVDRSASSAEPNAPNR
jgi:hypothetical protein